jgi:hypothetical protein
VPVAVERRLPGIRFEARPREPELVLPRMDVAAFVGIAASGPLHVPVAVEDPGQFEALFGRDAQLAWDEEAGAQTRALLAPAVRAFFRNGGRRCWVVRVARLDAAFAWFEVPGLARVGANGLEPALVRARSEGSWADGVRVAATLQAATLALVDSHDLSFTFAAARADRLAPGDLLRVTRADAVLLFVVASVAAAPTPSPLASPLGDGRALMTVHADPGSLVWLLRQPPPAGTGLALFRDEAGRSHVADVSTSAQAISETRPELELDGDIAPQLGSLVRVDLGSERFWLSVEGVHALDTTGSPASAGLRVVGTPFRPAEPPSPLPSSGPADLAERLTFELWARRGTTESWRLADLGFGAGHPRFVGDLPTDLELYRSREGERYFAPPAIWQSASTPRFPLAGPGDEPTSYVPLGMPVVPSLYAGPVAPTDPKLVRDGLSPFDDRLFLDDALREDGIRTLLESADFLRFKANRPRALRGIHALIGVEEATIVAVPDVVQRAWHEARGPGIPEPDDSEPLLRPEWWRFLPCTPPAEPDPRELPISEHYLCTSGRLQVVPTLSATEPEANGSFELSWTPVAEQPAEYVLEEAVDPAWADATVAYRGDDTRRRLSGRRGRHFYRVRAELGDSSSDWSNPLSVVAPTRTARPVRAPERSNFIGCDARVVEVPVPDNPLPDAEGTFTVRWHPIDDPDATYVLEEATSPDWRDARVIYRGRDLFVQLFGRALGAYYYRVRAGAGTASSDWSAGVAVQVAPATRWLVEPVDEYVPDTLLSVQRALLRLCAARGDMLAVLGLPRHYREDDAIAHASTLRTADDPRMLSFGALYHPWLTTPEPDAPQAFRVMPPDGAAAGVIARRADVRGAWIAPANERLRDVVVLSPRIRRDQLGRLQTAQVNVVRQEPRGFLWLSADTLSADEDLRPIGTRRLLSLLRRAALLHGAGYVFEPNDAVMHRSIQRGFEALLSHLYVRGAFTGATPDQAYRVDLGAPPNSRQSVEAGRLIVELKVAPSQPLTFLIVRVVEAGEGGLIVESR